MSGSRCFLIGASTEVYVFVVWRYQPLDCENVAGKINYFCRRFETMGPVITSLVQIVDSRRSFAETANLSRLTYLALVFGTLTFVSSLFSVVSDTAPGGRRTFWVYFAVVIPLAGLVFLIARPCQARVRAVEYLPSLVRTLQRSQDEVGA